MISIPSKVPQIQPVMSEAMWLSGTVTVSAIVPTGTPKAKSRHGKKLTRSQLGPQTSPVNA